MNNDPDFGSLNSDEKLGISEIPGVSGQPGPLLRLVTDYRVLFLVVGAVNTAVGFGWFILFSLTIGKVWGYMATLLFSHIFSVVGAFLLYRHLVFKVRGHIWRDLARFESVNLLAISINAIFLPIFVSGLGFTPITAQAIFTLISVIISFIGHNKFSFHRSDKRS